MQITMLTSLVAILGLTSAAPVPDAAIEARATASYYPSLAVNIFTPSWGTVEGDVYVFRYTEDGIHETTSLLSVPFPSGNAGKTCTFAFAGGWAPPHTNPNAQRVQLFAIDAVITASDTYTVRPARGMLYGSFSVSDSGAVATWDGAVPSFACPSEETTLGFEVAPAGDFDDVSWPLAAGLAVVVV